eukprot:18656-Heterococcus_DN1.PRE.1
MDCAVHSNVLPQQGLINLLSMLSSAVPQGKCKQCYFSCVSRHSMRACMCAIFPFKNALRSESCIFPPKNAHSAAGTAAKAAVVCVVVHACCQRARCELRGGAMRNESYFGRAI